MNDNYPPGVTGSEHAIAGPDYEIESETRCPFVMESGWPCGAPTMEIGFYSGERWLVCYAREHVEDLEPPDPGDDPDRKYDEERDRRILGDERGLRTVDQILWAVILAELLLVAEVLGAFAWVG